MSNHTNLFKKHFETLAGNLLNNLPVVKIVDYGNGSCKISTSKIYDSGFSTNKVVGYYKNTGEYSVKEVKKEAGTEPEINNFSGKIVGRVVFPATNKLGEFFKTK